ncbi:uncharacterized protein LOC129266951 [Lytechinus pictus]|uniref:uncharacterized protein LOC129266951 n=1 Tax=Lytechinus pictus TaxID=7653 RepID=UPI0030B9D0D9
MLKFDRYIPAHEIIPMRSVLTVCISDITSTYSNAPIISTLSDCFPNAKSLELSCDSNDFIHARKYHSDPPLSSWRQVKLDLWNGHSSDFVTLETIFLSLSSACQNIESLFIKSTKAFQWGKSSTTIKACKLPYLTDIHLEFRRSEEHYALQLIKDLLYDVNPGLKFVKVKSVQLGNVVLKSVEWSRTSSDCGLRIEGATAAVPITDLIDLTTSDLKDVTVLTLVSCKTDFGPSESKSLQRPKELGTLREIRFVCSENPLSESDRNHLSELYPNVKVTEKQESRESSEESQEGAGIPSKLDKASSQSLKKSAIDKLAEIKVECHKDTGSQNPEGGEEEISWQEKEEEFDVNKGSLSNESVPDEGDVETTKKECCKRVGADGGRLRLESFGIELEIPPGAIDSKEPQEISLHVLTDTPNLGYTKDEMSVCFGVQCLAPDDLVLRSPVTYTIPHCAVATRYSSLEAVLYTGEGEYTSDAEVKERILLTRSGIPNCIIEKDVLRLQMDHFSWFSLGFINSLFFRGKQMCCLPFAEKALPVERVPVILRVHLFDDIRGNEEMIMRKENRVGFDVIHPATELPINVTEEDVTMTCFIKDDRVGDAIVEYNDLWRGADRMRSFRLDLTNQPDRALVDLKVGQKGQRQEELICILRFTSLSRSPRPHDLGQLEGATGQTPHQQIEKSLESRVVTDEEITNLAGLLPDAKYSKICEELGFGYNYTQKVKTKHLLDSTAAFKEVLQEWKDKEGVMVDLDKALMESNLGGLIPNYKIQK